MKWYLSTLAVGVVVYVASVSLLASRVSDGATAQDGVDVPLLATQVSELNAQVGYLGSELATVRAGSIPGDDPKGYWIGGAYIYDHVGYGFDLLCTIGQTASDYLLHCTRPQPMTKTTPG